MKFLFYDKENNLLGLWWVGLFFLILLIMLLPVVLISRKYSFDVTVPLQGVLVIVTTWICQVMGKSDLAVITGRFDMKWLKHCCQGMIIGALLMLIPGVMLYETDYIEFTYNGFSGAVLSEGIALFLSVAITEELLFRGFIFQKLIKATGHWPAQLIIAALFLLTHSAGLSSAGDLKGWGAANIFLASILFGLAFIRTNSLALPLGIHFMANLMQGTVLGFGVSGQSTKSILSVNILNGPAWMHGGAFGLEASLPGLLSVVTAMAVLILKRNLIENH